LLAVSTSQLSSDCKAGSTCCTVVHCTTVWRVLLDASLLLSDVVVQGFCAKHSKKLEPDGTPRKATSSTPKKHSEMTEEEKKAAKARK